MLQRLNLPPGDTDGVSGLCFDPHDLATAKYVARREKDIVVTRALATRGPVEKARLLELLPKTPIDAKARSGFGRLSRTTLSSPRLVVFARRRLIGSASMTLAIAGAGTHLIRMAVDLRSEGASPRFPILITRIRGRGQKFPAQRHHYLP
jgi:hypothetical protein